MRHILSITDKDITGSDKLSAAQPRIAVNAVLFDVNNNIALCYMGKYDLHTLPGGGVEVGEDLHTATRREIWEETGCQCEIIGELGKIIENRAEHDFTQERSYYTARVIDVKGELHLTDEEIAENTSVVWLPIEQALRIISKKEHDNYQRKFIQKRDIAALTEAMLWLRFHDIPGYDNFTKIEPLKKGWSPDKKYYIETKDARKILLRVADTDELDRKKAEYNALGKTAELDVCTPRPCGFGLCNGGANVYYLVTWLEGEDAASVMASMTDEQRYALGIKSGELLRKLHTLPAPINAEPWNIRFQRKIDERLSQYHENKGQTENGELAIRYLNDNAQLLKNRRQTFTHGDFNTTNLIVSPNGEVGVIDFNCFNDNCDYGDPMFEMIAISYMETPDPYYYTGLWNGYAGGQPDTEFFAITAYYFAYDILSSLGGNESFDNGGFDKNALSWYDNFNRVVPSWYLKGCELWDVYDADRNLTGQSIFRNDAKNLKDGTFHLATFMYIMRSDGKFLITKRSPQKKTFPNMWEIPHGAVLSGETSLNAAIREAFEECGLVLQRENAEYITEYRDGNLISDKWLFRQDFNLADIVLQDGETCDVRACTPEDILELIKNNEMQEYIYHDIKLIKEKWGGAQ